MFVTLVLIACQLVGAFIALILTLYGAFRLRKYYRGRGGRVSIPGPPSLPFIGNLRDFYQHRRNTLPLFMQWAEQFGHTYKFTVLGDRDIILVNDPESIKHVLSTRFRDGVYGKGAYQQEQYRDLIGMGIFNSNPPLWKQQRKCAAPLFTTAALKSHVSVFHHHAIVLCDELLRIHLAGVNDPSSAYSTRGIDMQDYFLRFTLDSFSQIGFGFDTASTCAESNRFATAFDYVQSRCFNRMDYGVFWPWIAPADDKFKSHLKYMDDVVYACIAKAKAKSREELLAKQALEPDLLTQTLLDMTDESGRPNSTYSEVDLRDTVMNFLIAGRDTTALLLSWFFYQLSSQPDVESRIRREIDDVVGDEGELTFDALKRLTYLQHVIQESLRLYPSVPFNGFTALQDDVLPGGYFVPKDTYVVYSAYILHRRPDLFPDPTRFDPDRFERKPPKPFEYMSFHGGPRECFPESDTRVLTDRGFMFLGEIEAAFEQADKGLQPTPLFACYDTNSTAILYRPGRIVHSAPPTRWVDFTDDAERDRWPTGSIDGTAKGNHSQASTRVSLRVTPNHRMYVQTDNRRCDNGVATAGDEVPFRLLPANELAPGFACDCSAHAKSSSSASPDKYCPRGRGAMRFLAHAAAGITAESWPRSAGKLDANEDAQEANQADFLVSPKRQLGLVTDEQMNAFLELYGCWLVDGTVNDADRTIRICALSSDHRLDLLLPKVGLSHAKGEWLKRDQDGTTEFHITKPAWFEHFADNRPASDDAQVIPSPAAANEIRSLEQHDLSTDDSTKSVFSWVPHLDRRQVRLIIKGMMLADREISIDGAGVLYTSSAGFRDELVHLCLHGGYSAFFEANTHCADQRRHQRWAVHFDTDDRSTRPTIEIEHIRYGGASSATSNEQSGTAKPIADDECLYDQQRDGRVWCVEVSHPDHLILAQRAHRRPDGVVTRASRPVVVGNCLGREMAYLEAKIMIVTMMRRFRMRMHKEAKVELKRAIILTAKRGVHMQMDLLNQVNPTDALGPADAEAEADEATTKNALTPAAMRQRI